MNFIARILISALFLITGIGLTSAYAQLINVNDIQVKEAPEAHHICELEPTDRNAFHYIRQDDSFKKSAAESSAQIHVTYEDNCNGQRWPMEAVEAVEYALTIWETHISSSIPIRIRATWQSLESTIVGSAGPTVVALVPSPIGLNNTWYAVAQANAMVGVNILDTIEQDHDINMRLNCNREDWYFATDGNPPEDFVDMVTVVLHEIGHGLGFVGTMGANEDTELAAWGIDALDGTYPIIYDRFAEDGMGNNIIDTSIYPNPSNDLYRAVTGGEGGVFFNGNISNQVNLGMPVRMYSPSPWENGSSFSHLDQEPFVGTENALMIPFLDRATAIHTPGPVMCGILDDQRWPLGNGCLELLNVESSISFTETNVKFGISNVGRTQEIPVQVSNEISAEDTLKGRLVVNSRHFNTTENAQSFSIAPGESADLSVLFTPISVRNETTSQCRQDPTDCFHTATAFIFHNSNKRENPILLDLEGESLEPGRQVVLKQNFPNPFNSTTRIPYVLSIESEVKLEVFNSAGQRVATLVDGIQNSGSYEVDLNAGGLASGVYYYRILVNDTQEYKSLILVK